MLEGFIGLDHHRIGSRIVRSCPTKRTKKCIIICIWIRHFLKLHKKVNLNYTENKWKCCEKYNPPCKYKHYTIESTIVKVLHTFCIQQYGIRFIFHMLKVQRRMSSWIHWLTNAGNLTKLPYCFYLSQIRGQNLIHSFLLNYLN